MKESISAHFREHAPAYGWAVLAGYVLAFDIFAPATLSEGVDRALDHPVGKYAAIGGVAVTGAHLLNVYDRLGLEQYDPFVQAFNVLDRVREHVQVERS